MYGLLGLILVQINIALICGGISKGKQVEHDSIGRVFEDFVGHQQAGGRPGLEEIGTSTD